MLKFTYIVAYFNTYKSISFLPTLVLLLCCSKPPCFAQFLDKTFITYSTEDLLSDNKITTLTQDKFGFLWIGTAQGLCRFDGLNFKQYHSEIDQTSLPSDEILKLKWADSNNLATITRLGINVFNIETMKQLNLVIPPGHLKYTERVNNIRDLLNDEGGNYYIATRTGFYHLNANKQLVFRYDDYTLKEIESGATGFGIFMGWLDSHNIIVSGQKGIYCYNIDKKVLSKITGAHPNFLVFAAINRLKGQNCTIRQPWPGSFLLFLNYSDTAIYVDERKKLIGHSRLPISPIFKEISWSSELFTMKDSSLYITGKHSGFFKFEISTSDGSLKADTTKYFKKLECNSIFLDKQAKIWIGTNKGLWAERRNQALLQFAKLPDSITLANPVVLTQQITADDTNVYTASSSSGGLYVFNKDNLSFKRTVVFNIPEKVGKSLYTIIRWGNDTILCGAAGQGLFWYNTRNEKSGSINLPKWDTHHNWIANLYLDNNKNLWITSNKSNGAYLIKKGSNIPVWFSFDQPLVKNIKIIYRMDEDDSGNIWMAGNGLARFNTKKWMFDVYVDSFPALRWQQKWVSSLACDKKGNVWMGNSSNGLILFRPDNMSFTAYTKTDGLPDNTVVALKEVDGFLWIACRNGMAKMDLKTRAIFNVVSSRELLPGRVNGNRWFYDNSRDMLYIGVGPGMIRLKNDKQRSASESPHLLIENIVLGKDSLRWNPPGHITTSWREKNVTILFNAINYDDAIDQRYAYRIINRGDFGWIGLEDQRRLVIDNLTPGTYRIEIKVSSVNNRWAPNITSLVIDVKAPFWKTWWFLFLCALMIAGIIYVLLKYRINELKKMITVREKLSQDLHDEVGATLSGIAMYSHLTLQQLKAEQPAEVKKSLLVIQQSATEMVSRLSDIVWSVNPQNDSLKKLLEKLEDYATEIAIAKNIKVHINIPADSIVNLKLRMETRKNIYMICKEAINNAVKYSNASVLELAVKNFDHSLEFTINDNGNGFDLGNIKKGNGLENMQKRTAAIGAMLTLQPKLNEGTFVTLLCKITR